MHGHQWVDPYPPKRIVVVGGEFVGKTTFAARVASAWHLPHHDLDTIAWVSAHDPVDQRPLAERVAAITDIAAQPSWVAEGLYLWWTDPLMATADLIVWLDHLGAVPTAGRVVRWYGRGAVDEAKQHAPRRRFVRFGGYVHALRSLLGVVWRIAYFRLGPVPAPSARDDYSRITRRAVRHVLAPHAAKVIHVRSKGVYEACLAVLGPAQQADAEREAALVHRYNARIMDFHLTDEQRDLLLELLRRDLSELRGEITRTDNSVFKETLKGRESTLTALIETFETPATTS